MPSRSPLRCLLLLGVAGTLAAQEHAPAVPVSPLAPPRALAWPVPCARTPQNGAGFVIDANGGKPLLRWFAGLLHGEPLGSPAADAPGTATRQLLLGDFDGDGSVEVLARGYDGVELLRLDGRDAGLARTQRMRLQAAGERWLSGTACDWFGDGMAAVARTNQEEIVVQRRILAGDQAQTLLRFDPRDLPRGAGIVGSAGDFDLDGLPDLVIALPERGLVWYRNEGTRTAPRFSAAIPLWPATPGVVVTWILVAPIDGDPWPDVLMGTAAPASERAGDFELRVPRLRTPEQDAELRQLQAKIAGPELKERLGPLPGSGDPNPHDGWRSPTLKFELRRDELLWRDQQMTSQPPVVFLRSPRR